MLCREDAARGRPAIRPGRPDHLAVPSFPSQSGEGLPELDRAEGGGKGEELGGVREVEEGLGVSG